LNIRFACPVCEGPGRVAVPGTTQWQCPACEHLLPLGADADPALPNCVICGNPELYKKKDFPHGLGMTILVLACALATVAYALHHNWVTWAILIGSALFDGLLYLYVKDVVVCYRCNTHHQGLVPGPEHRPFELTVHERYRQERIRKAELKNSSP
jgi:hypothetical protein